MTLRQRKHDLFLTLHSHLNKQHKVKLTGNLTKVVQDTIKIFNRLNKGK